jgi:hypothetical protein
MLHALLLIALAGAAAASPPPAGTAPAASAHSPAPAAAARSSSPPGAPPAVASVVPFRTEAVPRIDPVFGDVTTFRASVDRFLSLQGEMDRVRDEFSSAVHATLGALATGSSSPAALAGGALPHACPVATAAPYARALASGGRYLALGQQLQASYREIRRSDDLGETLGLTPDYRLKVKRAKELHQQLLSDYREMRVAFYDQLGAELRHAGCRPGARVGATAPDANPSDPGAWEIEDPAAESGAPAPGAPPGGAGATPAPAARDEAAMAAGGAAPAIWIDIDNSLCAEPTRLSIDGQPVGDISARRKTSVRARSGPHELCALPASDQRSCGDAGTLRQAYLHEGWTLTIHCANAGAK